MKSRIWEVAWIDHILPTINLEINTLGKDMLCFFCGKNSFFFNNRKWQVGRKVQRLRITDLSNQDTRLSILMHITTHSLILQNTGVNYCIRRRALRKVFTRSLTNHGSTCMEAEFLSSSWELLQLDNFPASYGGEFSLQCWQQHAIRPCSKPY